jgi:hypothetical protein
VRSARVSADGDTLLFTSRGRVSGYDNHGAGSECGEGGTEACSEIYLYDATAHSLSCVSCNPAGAPATRDALLYHLENDGFIAPEPMYPANLPRNLSADGARVVFETEEALLPSDTNGQMDVYEWERAGSGSCLPTANSQGCLYLLSTGVSEESSYFAEASASADDVFLFTRQPLVAQDEDELVDVYDARVGGGIAAQNTVASAGECSGESCHPPQPPPTEPQPTISQTFTGSENLAPQPASAPVPVTHPSKKAHKRHKRKHAKQKRGHRGSSNRRAPRDRKTSAGRTR